MQRATLSCLAALGLLVTGACLPLSLHPLYGEGPALEVPEIEGCWSSDPSESEQAWFRGLGEGRYVMSLSDGPDEPQTRFEVRFVRLGGQLFWDLSPAGPEGDDFHAAHLLRAHSIARITLDEGSLSVADLSLDWLEGLVADGKAPQHTVLSDDRFVLTAPTAELQELITQHASDPNAFEATDTLKRVPDGSCRIAG